MSIRSVVRRYSSSDNKSDILCPPIVPDFSRFSVFGQSKELVLPSLFATISVFVNLQVTEKVLIPVHKIHNILLSP